MGWSVFKDWGALCRWKVHDEEPDTRDGLRHWEDVAKKGRAAHGPRASGEGGRALELTGICHGAVSAACGSRAQVGGGGGPGLCVQAAE